MGVIGQDLLSRLEQAEKNNDWDLVVEILAMCQIEAHKNYRQMCSDMLRGASHDDA